MAARYSKDDDNVIIEEVRDAALNLTVAYERAASRLGRTLEGVRCRWERHLSKGETIFVFGTAHSVVSNRKMAPRKRLNSGGFSEELLEEYFPNMSRARRLMMLEEIGMKRK